MSEQIKRYNKYMKNVFVCMVFICRILIQPPPAQQTFFFNFPGGESEQGSERTSAPGVSQNIRGRGGEGLARRERRSPPCCLFFARSYVLFACSFGNVCNAG